MVNKKSLNKRYEQSYQNKGSSSNGKKGVLNFKALDDEVTFYSPAEGRNRINIIPYTVKTKNHPLVKTHDIEIGDLDYLLDVFTHRNVGASESNVLCLKNTYGKPCPICELANKLQKEGKEDEAKALKPSRRVFYNVQDLKEPDKLKVFEASHYLFEKELIDEARDDEHGGFVNFADVDEGKEIKFKVVKEKKGGYEFNSFKSFSFEEREEALDEDLVNSAISFDEILNVPTYEEVENILYGQDEDEAKSETENVDDEDEAPAKKPIKHTVVEDDEDEKVKLPPKKAKKVDPEDVTEEDEENAEEVEIKPAKKCKGKCPHGHNFGDDTDGFDDCDDCDCWDSCAKA